ncbi:MAG TPA: M20/M25/M40 family metallo-hydrolase [Bacteroidota bacterium]|nr:M20/M25/M40 family metallo-hydrolase [Bacteroidota bacterium]
MNATKIIVAIILVCSIYLLLVSMRTRPTQGEPATHTVGETLLSYVKGIEGKSHEGRQQYITTKLKEFGIPYSLMPFDTVRHRGNGTVDTLHGENIVVTRGYGHEKIVLGAHYDAVPGAPGANDNGGGVAVVLEIIRSLKDSSFRNTVDFCFFDREENGLVGSAVYARTRDRSYKHLAMINLDVEGTGNELYVGPVGGGDDDVIMKFIHEARDKTKYAYNESAYYPESDNESFANSHLENISISVVPKGDSDKLSRWTKSGFKPFEKPEDVPEVLNVMHSPRDSSTYVTPDALTMSYTFTKTTLLLLDEKER